MTRDAPENAAMPTWGDFLLTFDPQPPAAARQKGGWIEEACGGSSKLWRQRAGSTWRGFPVKRMTAPDTTLWLVGELYGDAATRPDVLLEVAAGRRSPSELNGHFALLGWNAVERQWHVWTDRFGTVHVYAGGDGPRRAIGTHFASVAAAASRRRLDWPALAGFFACGFFPGDRTFFDDVRILRPSTHSVFESSGELVREERYWSWSHVPDRTRSYGDTVAEFAGNLHRVLDDDAACGRIAVPISGGLDSRTTVAALTRPGSLVRERLWSYSYGYAPDSIETQIARRVAAARGVPIETLVIEPYLFQSLPSILACVEGFQDVTQARQAVVAGRLAEASDAVIAAHWGDVWLDSMGAAEGVADEAAVAEHAFHKVAKRGRAWLLGELARPRLSGEDPEAVARRFVGAELRPYRGIADPDFRVKAFKTDQWSFRWTLASLRMYQAGTYPRLPFYDTRLTDFFATVPTSFVEGRRLQIDYLKRFAPDLARIPWQAYGVNLYWQRHFDTWLLPWRAARKVARALRRNGAVAERNWEVQFSGPGAETLRTALLARGSRVHEFVSPAAIERLLDAFAASPLEEGRGYTVSMLLTFSAWLEAHG